MSTTSQLNEANGHILGSRQRLTIYIISPVFPLLAIFSATSQVLVSASHNNNFVGLTTKKKP